MNIIVQKYGGSSVKNAERLKAVADRIVRAKDGASANALVAVVSAMGDTTDELIQLAKQISPEPHPRELDLLLSTGETISCTLLAMALRETGCDAVSLTGAQAGIRTDRAHGKARIASVEPKRVMKELERDSVVIVAGFQGVNDEFDITTLGRGGSDTTAVALAISLGAKLCEIYTDVDGVYTADPNLVPEARKLDEISYEEMLEMAQQGAKVMQPRAVELGEVYKMPIMVRSSFSTNEGTIIHEGKGMENRNKVRGIAHDSDVAKVTLVDVPDKPGVAWRVFMPLAEATINVDTIVQNIGSDGVTDLSFTVTKAELPQAVRLVEKVAQEVGVREIQSSENMAKISIVGTGIQSHPGYAARMFKALADADVNIDMISTSEIRITCLIDDHQVETAAKALHKAFQLEKPDV